jgi:hypothetical protein
MKRASGGRHIVYKHDGFSIKLRRIGDQKSRAHITPTRLFPEPALSGGILDPSECI